jgi:hypothetical protein
VSGRWHVRVLTWYSACEKAGWYGGCLRKRIPCHLYGTIHKQTYLWFMHVGASHECDTGATTPVNHEILPRSKADLIV